MNRKNTHKLVEKIEVKANDWIPFTFDENGELDCKIPEEDEEVLISDGEEVWLDVFRYDEEGYYFEWKGSLLDGVAWQPKPKPYRKEN